MSTVITIAQQKGGVGKTTFAINFAYALHNQGHNVLLIDTDPQATTSQWFGLRKQLVGDNEKVKVIEQQGWKVGSEISSHRFDYDYIVIDSAPHAADDAKTVIREADLVIIPLQPSIADIWATKRTIKICKTEGSRYQLVLNRVNSRNMVLSDIEAELGTINPNYISNRVAFAKAMAQGKTIFELTGNKAAKEEFSQVALSVNQALEPA